MRAGLSCGLAVAALALLGPGSTAGAEVLFHDSFGAPAGPNGVVASGISEWSGECTPSRDWRSDGGTWFGARGDGPGWSGNPDPHYPEDCASSTATGSATLRMWTRRADFGEFRIETFARVNRLAGSPSRDWDGVKFYVRRQTYGTESSDDDDFYTVEPFRRDGDAHIQKKRAGRYHDVVDTRDGSNPIRFGRWRRVRISVRDGLDGAVSLRVELDGRRVAAWRDSGAVGGPPLRAPGNVGFRGDNADFNLDGFLVVPADGAVSVLTGGVPIPAWRRSEAFRDATRPLG